MDSFQDALGSRARSTRFFVYLLTWNEARGKFDKKPIGSPVQACMSYHQAHAEAMRLRAAGQLATVGMWIDAASGLFFADIDALPADYTADDRATRIHAMFPGAFVEWSTSKRGLHIVGTMQMPVPHSSRNDALHLELYTRDRGIALNIDGRPVGCMDTRHDIAPIVAAYFPPRIALPNGVGGVRAEWRGPSDDSELVRRMLNARQSAESAFGSKPSLAQLWHGQAEKCSENDMALCAHLAFWTGCNAERMTGLLWQSGLVREKWRTHRTYLQLTIANACAACTNVYQEPQRALPMPQQSAGKYEIRSAAQLLTRTFKPVQWAIRDILPQGVTIISGSPKVGKSFLVYQMCIAIAAGHSLWSGRAPETQGDALYLDLEGNERRLRDRLDTQLVGFPGADVSRLNYCTEWPRAEAGVALIREFLAAHPACRIVVIDTVSAFRETDPGRLSAYAHDYSVGEILKPLAREFDCAIVLVMHNRKQQSADWMQSVSGTQGLTGSVDNVLSLERARGDLDAALRVDGRDIREAKDLALRLEGGRWRCIGEVADVQRTQERNAVLNALRMLGGAGTAKQIHDAMGGVPKLSAVKMRLSRMMKDGQVENGGAGIYTLPGPIVKTTFPIPGAGA